MMQIPWPTPKNITFLEQLESYSKESLMVDILLRSYHAHELVYNAEVAKRGLS